MESRDCVYWPNSGTECHLGRQNIRPKCNTALGLEGRRVEMYGVRGHRVVYI